MPFKQYFYKYFYLKNYMGLNKKGVSEVVVTVLLILVAIVAIGAVGFFINNLVSNLKNGPDPVVCISNTFTIVSAKVNAIGILSVKVEKKQGSDNIEKLKFFVEGDSGTIVSGDGVGDVPSLGEIKTLIISDIRITSGQIVKVFAVVNGNTCGVESDKATIASA